MESSVWVKLKNAVVISCILTVVTIFINAVLLSRYSWQSMQLSLFWSFYYGVPISMVNEIFFEYLNSIYSWKQLPKNRAWFGFLGSIIVTMITLVILNYIYVVLYCGKPVSTLFSSYQKKYYVSALGITIFISSIMHARGFYHWAQEEKLVNEKLRKEKAETELNVLKAQIDPHFLFNSFNILSGLIDENPKKAQTVLDKLSSIYRYILENRNENTESIESEIQFAEKYLSIQQARFEDSIFLNIDIEDRILKQSIPSLSLQMLLENAIKHNAFSLESPLVINIKSDEKYLIVSNNKNARTNLVKGNGIGLQNIKDRYILLTNQDILIEDLDTHFVVKLPIINNSNV